MTSDLITSQDSELLLELNILAAQVISQLKDPSPKAHIPATYVFHSCDLVLHQGHRPPAGQRARLHQSFPSRTQTTKKSHVRDGLTATEVTEDLLKRRSASLNFLFLLSVLLLEFLSKSRNEMQPKNHPELQTSSQHHLLLVGEVSVPSSDDVAVHLGVFQVAAFKCIDLSFQVHQRLLSYLKPQTQHQLGLLPLSDWS